MNSINNINSGVKTGLALFLIATLATISLILARKFIDEPISRGIVIVAIVGGSLELYRMVRAKFSNKVVLTAKDLDLHISRLKRSLDEVNDYRSFLRYCSLIVENFTGVKKHEVILIHNETLVMDGHVKKCSPELKKEISGRNHEKVLINKKPDAGELNEIMSDCKSESWFFVGSIGNDTIGLLVLLYEKTNPLSKNARKVFKTLIPTFCDTIIKLEKTSETLKQIKKLAKEHKATVRNEIH